MKKNFLAGLLSSLIILFSCNSNHQNPKLNFIIIYTDDQQFDGLGIYNSKVKTPELDRFSSQAFHFTNAHVAFSLCSPSRAALLTGRYGSNNGVLGLGSALNKNEKTLPDYLKNKGYKCGHTGKWHIKQRPKSLGFDISSYFIGNGKYYGREVINDNDTVYPENHIDEYGVKQSVRFIDDCVNDDTPFFLFHCPQTPHMNGKLIWVARIETKGKYRLEDMPVPKNHLDNLENKPPYLQTVRNRIQAKKYGYPDSLAIQKHALDYYSVISELDSYLGKLLKHIEDIGIMDNTYVIFMSDNGWMLGDHGFTSKVLPYLPSTHVPFWIIGPGISKSSNNSIVSNLDILPTILELAHIEIPANVHGKSIVPILNNEEEKVRDYFIYEGLGIYGGSKYNLAVIKNGLRYIVTYTDKTLSQINFRELYDIFKDPQEINNLIDEKKYLSILNEMDGYIEDFKQKNLQML